LETSCTYLVATANYCYFFEGRSIFAGIDQRNEAIHRYATLGRNMLKVTIGHRIKGEKSKYISVKPEQVKVCADIIYEEYFG
jgi:hypothetical protein